MEEFLKGVARVYVQNEKENLLDYCFVFPNKRSGVFFGKHVAEIAGHSVLLPEITTINEFVLELNDKTEASRYEQLFLLYNIYKDIFKAQKKDDNSEPYEFDKFQFWGDMLINDFNDVDRYLVNASELFQNVKNVKEINSNYLTQEQIEVINKYFGENIQYDESQRFWTHLSTADTQTGVRDKFVKIWSKMYEIYDKYNQCLSQNGLTYSGKAYRDASERLKHISAKELRYKRYVFVGFNVLSTSEIKIFERLKSMGCADFYWDYNSPGYIGTYNKASRFLARYVDEFKSLYDTCEGKIVAFPNITIIGVASNIGQVKEVGNILSHLSENGMIANNDNACDTAVVLPDENLFVPLINSYPEKFGNNVNITMGYPMRYTSIASLMNVIISMHLRARKVKGEFTYFYEDIKNLLSQPLFVSVAGDDCEKLQRYINEGRRIFNVPCDYLLSEYPGLMPIFRPVKDITQVDDVFDYAVSLVDFLSEKIKNVETKTIDRCFIERYRHTLYSLRELVKRYGILMQEHTFFHLIERAISSDTINFKGEPLHGLQVMGVLETRALDFRNVIMTSMNERIFPRKHYKGSFIPDALRRSYGMSTIEFQESIYAYYFYRLISRAENVFLLYDTRGKSGRSADMSRYLYQLKYLFPQKNIKFHTSDYKISLEHDWTIKIDKTDDIMRKINRYKNPESGKYLSASSIKTLVHCPLQFYLQYVEEFNVPDEIVDYIDKATLGTIVHEVMEKLYKPYCGKRLLRSQLTSMRENEVTLSRLITRAVNRNFNKLDKCIDKVKIDDILLTPLTGQEALLSDIIMYLVKKIILEDEKSAPFTVYETEYKKNGRYRVNDDLEINVKVIIDRIDSMTVNGIPETCRIVDYKTGTDEISTDSIEQLFDNECPKNNAAILQLLTYCVFLNAIDSDEKYKGKPIQPIIYLLKNIYVKEIQPIVISKQPVYDYRDFINDYSVKEKNEEKVYSGFIENFHKVLENLFDSSIPFEQTKSEKNCTFCKFKMICGKDGETDV